MTAEKSEPKKRKQRPSTKPDLCTFEELAYTGASDARYQKIAEPWSFYVTQRPRVWQVGCSPTQQSIELKERG